MSKSDTNIYCWNVIDELEFLPFKVRYSPPRDSLKVSKLLKHLVKNTNLKFNESNTQFEFLANSKINGNTLLFGQPILLSVYPCYSAIVSASYEKNVDGCIANYNKLRIFSKQILSIDLTQFNTVDLLTRRCIQLCEHVENANIVEYTVTVKNVSSSSSSIESNRFTSFVSSGWNFYWVYVPELTQENLIAELSIRGLCDEYLLLLLDSQVTTKKQLKMFSPNRQAFELGIPMTTKKFCCLCV